MMDEQQYTETEPATRAAARRPRKLPGPALVGETVEVWLPVPGLDPRMEASNFGRVRSWCKKGARNAAGEWISGAVADSPRLCSTSITGPGYRLVKTPTGRPMRVHRLVAAAFYGPCPPDMEVRHLDGDPANNELSNLLYGTHEENMSDSRWRMPCDATQFDAALSDAAVASVELPDAVVAEVERNAVILSVVGTLRPRERDVVRLRFGLDDNREHTLEEVGGRLGVTRERVRQIEAKALRKLRHGANRWLLHDLKPEGVFP